MTNFGPMLEHAVRTGACLSLVLSKNRKGHRAPIKKLTVRPIVVKGQSLYQLTSREAGRETHVNLNADATINRLRALFGPALTLPFVHARGRLRSTDHPQGRVESKEERAHPATDRRYSTQPREEPAHPSHL